MKKIAVIVLLLAAAVAFPVFAQEQTEPAPQPEATQPVTSQQTTAQQSAPNVFDGDLYNHAIDLRNAKDYKGAVLNYSLFILLNPTFSPAYYGRAQSYIGLNDLDHAVQDIDHALDTAGSIGTPGYSAGLYALRGELDRQNKQLDDALKDFTQSITLMPTPDALVDRGLLYASQSDFPSALQDFNDAIALDSSNPALFIYRGLIHGELKDQPSMGADFLQFLKQINTSVQGHPAIVDGQVITLQMDQGVVYQVPFTAKAGQYASALAVARSGDVDPLMVLVDESGKPLTGDDNSGSNGSALILNYQVPADGDYAFLVGHSIGGYTGTILVQFSLTDTPAQ